MHLDYQSHFNDITVEFKFKKSQTRYSSICDVITFLNWSAFVCIHSRECMWERDGEDVKIFTHKNNWENLKTFFFWKFLEGKRSFPFIKITVLDIEYLITESMLWESVRVPLLSRWTRRPFFQSKNSDRANMHRMRHTSKSTNELWKVRHSFRSLYLFDLQSFWWWRQVTISLRVMWNLPCGWKGSILSLCDLQHVSTYPTSNRWSSMCREC